MFKRYFFVLSLPVLLTPSTAFPAETAKVFFRYLEIPYDGSRDTADLLKDLSDGKNLPEAAVEFSTFTIVPAEGKEVYVASTEPRIYGVEGVETTGQAGIIISALARPVSSDAWALTLMIEVGEQVPHFESRGRKDKPPVAIQRSRLAGYRVELERAMLEAGIETVIHVDVEKTENKSVCRVLTAAIYPEETE